MPELVSPGSCPEMVAAAVHNGADAIYMGFGILGSSNTKRGMTVTEFAKSAEFCRIRGVKVYGLMNIFAADGEYEKLYDAAMYYNRMGANALIAQDLGVIRFLHQILPDMPIFGGQNLGIHDEQGIKICSAIGLKRLSLPVEMTRQEIANLALNKGIDLEVTVHGPMCMAFPGSCHMNSLFSDKQTSVPERCGDYCRTEMVSDGRSYGSPMGMRDICLIDKVSELNTSGIAAYRIAGYSREPEYVAMVTGIYSRFIREGKMPSREEMTVLQEAYCKSGFTQGFYNSPKGEGSGMLGGGIEGTKANPQFFSAMRRYYINNEYQRVPLRFLGQIKTGQPVRLAAIDDHNNIALAEGEIPHPAFHKAINHTTLQTELFKLGGTPFYCNGLRSQIDDGLYVSVESIGQLLENITDDIKVKRKVHTPFDERPYPAMPQKPNFKGTPVLTASVTKAMQLRDIEQASAPSVIYIPAGQILKHTDLVEPFLKNPDVQVVAALPRVLRDSDKLEMQVTLENLKKFGITCIQAESISQIFLGRKFGFSVRGGFGLNVYNSRTLDVLSNLGVESAGLPFDMSFSQIDGMSKALPVEILVYGRMPLMTTESCLVKNRMGICGCENFSGIHDKQGFGYPVVREPDCGNTIYTPKKLYFADRTRDYSSIGVWGARLSFTTENSMECAAILRRYRKDGDFRPQAVTRGLYYRDVEDAKGK